MVRETNTMLLKSPAFENGGFMNEHNTCDSYGYSPSFVIVGVPFDAKSLVLVMDDLDSPDEGGVTNHWLVWNIPSKTTFIEENELPESAVEGRNDLELEGYAPPCPDIGVHRYEFRLYAIDRMLDLDKNSIKNDVLKEIEDSVLAEACLMGLYQIKNISDDDLMGFVEKSDIAYEKFQEEE